MEFVLSDVVSNVVCHVCKCGEESIYHIFAECHYARIYCALSYVSHITLMAAGTTQTVKDWIIVVRKLSTAQEFDFFVCSCWSIWANRNKIIYEGAGFEPLDANHFIARYIDSYQTSRAQFATSRTPVSRIDD